MLKAEVRLSIFLVVIISPALCWGEPADEEKVDEEIEAIGEKFEWDDDKTAEMVKSLLRGTPPQARKYALESMTRSMEQYLKREDTGTVDKEMICEAVEDAIPPPCLG